MTTEHIVEFHSSAVTGRTMNSICDDLPCRNACPARRDFDGDSIPARGCPFLAALNARETPQYPDSSRE